MILMFRHQPKTQQLQLRARQELFEWKVSPEKKAPWRCHSWFREGMFENGKWKPLIAFYPKPLDGAGHLYRHFTTMPINSSACLSYTAVAEWVLIIPVAIKTGLISFVLNRGMRIVSLRKPSAYRHANILTKKLSWLKLQGRLERLLMKLEKAHRPSFVRKRLNDVFASWVRTEIILSASGAAITLPAVVSDVWAKPKDVSAVSLRCSMPMRIGPCRMSIEKFYYDAEKNDCLLFFYGGCKVHLIAFII